MDSKRLNTIVEGLYPLVKKNSKWITRNKLEKLSKLLKCHNYFEGTRIDLEISMAYTYLNECNFYCKLPQVKEDILDEFKELFAIYTWLRNTLDYQVSITIPRKEVHKVIDKVLEKLPKRVTVYFVKQLNGWYSPAEYCIESDKVNFSEALHDRGFLESKLFLLNPPKNHDGCRYANKDEVESYLTKLYGVTPKNIPDDVILEFTFE